MGVNGWGRGGFHRGFELERRIGFRAVEGRVGIRISCAARLIEPMQLTEVVSFQCLGQMPEELEQICHRLVGKFQRDTDDGQVIRFHGGGSQVFFGFFAARDLALRAVRSCASL
jgi:hypothetical protein